MTSLFIFIDIFEESDLVRNTLSNKLSMIFEDFPHNSLFYNEFMSDIITGRSEEFNHADSTLLITLVINLLPIASESHWRQNGIELVFKSNESKMSYDSIIEGMQPPFDPTDEIHIKILEHFITLIIGEILFFVLEKTSGQLSSTIVDILQDIFSHYATKELSNDFTSLIPFIQKLFLKCQEIWSRNFGMLSRNYFEEWHKMLQTAIIEDLNNNDEDSVTPNLKITFYKYLWITPTRKLVSSHVLFLLNNLNHALRSKKLDSSTKSAVLESLKCLLSHLTFDDMSATNSSSSIEEDKNQNREDTDTKLLWPSVKLLYQNWYKLSKLSSLKLQAVNVMITILRKSPRDFFKNECSQFL